MGFFDSLWGRRSEDPLQDLDPKVRDFLKKESPAKLNDSKKPSQQDKKPPAAAQQPAAAAGDSKPENAVPKESLYQDGRYAHLWKTYRPLSEVENETKSDAEKLSDVLDAFKSRKAEIGHAALENCAEEQFDWRTCMSSGSITARMTMCSDEVRKFERCYNMQSRLLKALGYLNNIERSPERDEKIQLHADKLYHQMLEQEQAIEKAQKEGKPAPNFEPIIPKQVAAGGAANDILSESAKKRYADKLSKVDDKDREAERAAIDAEMRSKAEMVRRIQGLWKEQEAERQTRKERGEETIKDKVTAIFKSSPNSSDDKKS